MRRPWAVAALCALLVSLVAPAVAGAQATPSAAGHVTIASQGATSNFPNGVIFTLDARADFTVTRVELLYRVATQATEHLATVPMGSPSSTLRISYALDLETDFVPAGIDLLAFWRFHGAAGQAIDGPSMSVRWFDNRFHWTSITTADTTVWSYGLSPAFAQNIATSAQQTIDSLKTLYGMSQVTPVQIWVYPNTGDFAGSRQQNSREAVAGLSYPEFALTTAVVPDGSASELGRVIPHEMSHQMLYQATRNPWNAPPVWLDEGLAEYAQIGGTDGFTQSVSEAARVHGLLGLAGLTLSYPYDPQAAYLAYAESYSIVEYIVQKYGDAGITRLVRALASGVSYDDAFTQALGRSMAQLEADWRTWIAQEGFRTPMPASLRQAA